MNRVWIVETRLTGEEPHDSFNASAFGSLEEALRRVAEVVEELVRLEVDLEDGIDPEDKQEVVLNRLERNHPRVIGSLITSMLVNPAVGKRRSSLRKWCPVLDRQVSDWHADENEDDIDLIALTENLL